VNKDNLASGRVERRSGTRKNRKKEGGNDRVGLRDLIVGGRQSIEETQVSVSMKLVGRYYIGDDQGQKVDSEQGQNLQLDDENLGEASIVRGLGGVEGVNANGL
jgi:hypothetical protein